MKRKGAMAQRRKATLDAFALGLPIADYVENS
jgi:hypothetical protein